MRNVGQLIVSGCLAVVLAAPIVLAQEPDGTATTPVVATSPPATPEEAARTVLDKHCARCHESGRGVPAAAVRAFDNIFELSERTREIGLVRPGQPDASRLYNVMVSGHVPEAVYDATNPGPSPDEIDQVRGWIEGLARTTASATCPKRRLVTLADEGRALDRLRGPGAAALKGIRFISLAAYHNGCASEPEMEAMRRAVSELVTALRTTLVEFDLPLAADDMPLLAVRLGDMGWDPSQWDALAAQAGAPQLTDTGLAEDYGTATPLMDVSDLATAAAASGNFPRVGMLGAEARSFARYGSQAVDLSRAAADLGRVPASLLEQLASVQGKAEGLALALRQGSIPMQAWRELRAILLAGAPEGALVYPAAATSEAASRLDVALWTEKAQYAKGELIVLTAQVNRDCNLTVVNVDPAGEATVLFPSDSDPDNAVKANAKIRVPSDIEPYQLRASDLGTETFIAVCTLNRKRLLGVDQDFEKQRFSVLGNWRVFLKTAATRETLVGRRDTPRQRRARAKAAAAQTAIVTQPEQEARSAIYVKVE